MEYQVEIKRSAARDLRALPRSAQSRVARKIDTLRHHPFPRGCKKLAGAEDLWRLRVGDYRILYSVRQDARVVYIARIRQRGGAYGTLPG